MKRHGYGRAIHRRTMRRLPLSPLVVYHHKARSRIGKCGHRLHMPVSRRVMVAVVMSGALVCGAVLVQHITNAMPLRKERHPVPQIVQHTRVVIVQDDTLPPVLQRIAQCESHGQQFTMDGRVVRGRKNPQDTGLFQINTAVWGTKAEALGYNLHSREGNVQMARYLFEQYGSVPWQTSFRCWSRYRS
jgi:hypothetical protein